MRPPDLSALLVVSCFLIAGCGANPSNKTGTPAAGNVNGSSTAGGTTRPAKSDDAFARDTVVRLLDGDTSVEGAFDWENLKVPGSDVGAPYREMPDDENRQAFRKGFIERFSASFKETGASASDLKNWREQSKKADVTTVVADAPNGKSVVVSVSHTNGQQKVTEIIVR